MLKIFRTDILLQSAIILIVSALMWVGAFVHPQPLPMVGGGQLYYWLTGWISPLWGAIIAYVLVLLEGLLLNIILYRNKIITQNTLMPMLFYVIAMSLESHTLTPILLGSLVLLIAIDQLILTSTLLSLPLNKIFGAAAATAIATLFCPSMSVFFIPLIMCMFNYSLYGWRDWSMLILGTLAPYILLETFYFVNDQMFYRNYLMLYGFTDIHLHIEADWVEWIGSVVFLLTLLFGLGTAFINAQNRTINFKKNISTILMFIFGSMCYALYTSIIPIPTQAYAIPFACSTTSLFIEPRRKEFGRNLVFLLLIIVFIVWKFI